MSEEWPPWPLIDQVGLSRYVVPGVERLLPGVNRRELSDGPGKLVAVAKALYEGLVDQDIHYDVEGYHPSEALQRIRTPVEVLSAPRRGTCLDLALVYAGLLADYELLAVVVVLDSHALVLFSPDHGIREWNDYRPGSEEFRSGVVADPAVARRLVESGRFIAVECTGFASTGSDPDGTLAAAERVNGMLRFDRAVEVGRKKVLDGEAGFRFAFDVAIMRNVQRVEPHRLPNLRALAVEAEMNQYVIPHNQAIRELSGRAKYLLDKQLRFVTPGADHEADPAGLIGRLESGTGVLLIGPAGAGKSRTSLEVAIRAQRKGWRVLHVRPDSEVSNDHLAAAVRDTSSHRTLLVIDYLEVCGSLDLPDLLAKSGPYLAERGRHLAIIATSRPNRLRHVRSLGALDVLDQVELRLDTGYQDEVAEHIFASVAPTALKRLGMETMIEICSRRPVIALLVAGDVERRVRLGRTPRAGGGPDVLVRWLHRRLEEDGIIPSSADTPGDSPFVDDAPQAVLLACALATALCPMPVARVRETIQLLLDRLGDPTRAEVLIDVLLTMGWLESRSGELDIVHDIVTDQFLVEALAPAAALRVRDTALNTLLDLVRTEADALDHVTGNIARMHADLVRSTHAQQLTDACVKWIDERSHELGATFAASPDGGHTLYTLLHAEPWQTGVISAWDTVVEPWLRTAIPDVDQVRFFRYSLASVPEHGAGPLAIAALVWLAGNRENVEPVLSRLLRRSDLSREQRTVAVKHALEWLSSGTTIENATFALRGLLDFPTEVEEVDRRSIAAALAWLAVNPVAPDADFVLSGLLAHRVLSDDRSSAVDHALQWLDRYGRQSRASFVLSRLLRMTGLDDGRSARLVSLALDWAERYREDQRSSHVLRPLFDWVTPESPDHARLVSYASAWVRVRSDTAAASFVLPRLLSASPVSPADAAQHARYALQWLDHRDEATNAFYVLRSLIGCVKEVKSADIKAKALDHSLAWLGSNLDEPEAGQIFGLLATASWPAQSERSQIITLALTWVVKHAEHSTVPSTLIHLVREALPEHMDEICATADDWLATHRSSPDFPSLARLVISQPEVNSAHANRVAKMTFEWMTENRESEQLPGLLQSMASKRDAEFTYLEQVAEKAWKWLDTHPEHDMTPRLLRSLIGNPTVKQANATRAAKTARKWIEEHPGHEQVVHLLRSLIGNPNSDVQQVNMAMDTALDWMDTHHESEHVPGLLQSMASKWDAEFTYLEQVAEKAWKWLDTHPEHDMTPRLLRSLIGNPNSDVQQVNMAMDTALDWMDTHHESEHVPGLLQSMASKWDAEFTYLEQVAEKAWKWLDTHPEHDMTPRLLRSLIGNPTVKQANATRAAKTARKWIEEHPGHEQVVHLLRSLIGNPNSDVQQVNMVMDTALDWMDTHHESEHVPGLLQSMASKWDAEFTYLEQVAEKAWKWLDTHPEHDMTPRLLRSLIGNPHAAQGNVDKAAQTIVAWLENHSDDVATADLLRALGGSSADIGHVNRAAGTGLAWARTHPDHEETPRLLKSMTSTWHPDFTHLERITAEAWRWLDTHVEHQSAPEILRSLIGNPNATQDNVDKAARTILTWVETHPNGDSTPHLLRSLTEVLADEGHVNRGASLALGWIDDHPDSDAVPQLVRAMVGNPLVDPLLAESAMRKGLDWVDGHSGEEAVPELLRSLLTTPAAAPTDRTRVVGAALAWTRAHPEHTAVEGVLDAVQSAESQDLSD
ncbi:hypothetical protein [Saccharothrix sp. HUAS TT1]|uniref:P-loop NTPase n=1 Tax=unclassified Saccharothrix TaxID=2593673 RepID=UPI00345BEE9C